MCGVTLIILSQGGGGSVNHGFDKQSGYGDALEHGLVKIVFLG